MKAVALNPASTCSFPLTCEAPFYWIRGHREAHQHPPSPDWRYRDSLAPPGSSLGEDFAGVVVKAAEGSLVAEGERVAGIVQGGIKAGHGVYSEYVKTGSTLVWRIPESLDWEEAAALGGIGPRESRWCRCLLQIRCGLLISNT